MKDLITKILTHLKENKEVRERFNKHIRFDFFGNDLIDFTKDGLSELHDFEKEIFLIHALSSPNGKPICGFLEEECDYPNCQNGHYPLGAYEDGDIDWGACPKCVDLKAGGRIYPKNHAKTLNQTFFNAINEGKSFEEAYKITNDKYNEL